MGQSYASPLPGIDDFIEAFENARDVNPQVSILEFLPAEDHPLYAEIGTELARVEMEYSWDDGDPKSIADYQAQLPIVFADKGRLGQIAFEEFRLRTQSGENVLTSEYARRFQIDTSSWPSCNSSEGGEDDGQSASKIEGAWQDALTLADDVEYFPEVGSEFLGFSLEKLLGQGAFAQVFLASQSELSNRLVVLKVACGNSLEPQHLARLQHTNIVPIYSVHHGENLTAVCMPFFGSSTLAGFLNSERETLPSNSSSQNLISTFLKRKDDTVVAREVASTAVETPPDKTSTCVVEAITRSTYVDAVAWIMRQLADGLEHAHQRGIVHRDLKPSNILLTDEGVPMVLDFNLSQDVIVHGPKCLTVGGTFPYMSPEQLGAVVSGDPLKPATDIYSLGVIFYEMLTGARPFPDRRGTLDEVVSQAIADRQSAYPGVRELNPTVPPSLASVVEQCLAPEPQNRYGSMAELSDDLTRHLEDLPLRHAPNRSILERGQKWLRRHPRLASGGGVATIAAVLLLALMTAFFVRGQHLAKVEAQHTYDEFMEQKPSVIMGLALGVTRNESQILHDGIESARTALGTYGVLDDQDWQERTQYASLSKETRKQLDERFAEILYLLARAHAELAELDSDQSEQRTLLEQASEFNRLAGALFTGIEMPKAIAIQRAQLSERIDPGVAIEKPELQFDRVNESSTLDRYAEIYQLLDDKDYESAAPELAALRDSRPTDPTAWLLLGDSNAVLGKLSEAEGCLSTSVALQGGSFIGYFHRGLCRLELGQHQAALEDFNKVIELRPDLTGGYLNRAIAYRAMGRYQEALADLSTALEKGATQTRIYFIRSELKRQLDDYAGAKEDFEKGLSLTPSDELSWVARGVALLKSDPQAALADFENVLKLNPRSVPALRNCVHVLADRLNRPAEAMTMLDKLLSLNPRDVNALAGRAVLLAREGKREEAHADVGRLLQISKDPKSLFQAACAYSLTSDQEQRDLAKGISLLSGAVLANPAWMFRAASDPDLANLRATDQYQSLVGITRSLRDLILELNKDGGSAATKEIRN